MNFVTLRILQGKVRSGLRLGLSLRFVESEYWKHSGGEIIWFPLLCASAEHLGARKNGWRILEGKGHKTPNQQQITLLYGSDAPWKVERCVASHWQCAECMCACKAELLLTPISFRSHPGTDEGRDKGGSRTGGMEVEGDRPGLDFLGDADLPGEMLIWETWKFRHHKGNNSDVYLGHLHELGKCVIHDEQGDALARAKLTG